VEQDDERQADQMPARIRLSLGKIHGLGSPEGGHGTIGR
jgi:hypothetical protein